MFLSQHWKDHECLLVPTLGALRYHMLRSEYVLKTVFAFTTSTVIDVSQYGWRIDNSMITVIWDNEETMKAVVGSEGCGCKGAKCDGSTAGCRNCYKMCKPCNSRCKCKGNCRNPHNNGGTCGRCEHDENRDTTDDEEQAPETLPLVTRSADTIDSTTVTMMLMLPNYVHNTSQMITRYTHSVLTREAV